MRAPVATLPQHEDPEKLCSQAEDTCGDGGCTGSPSHHPDRTHSSTGGFFVDRSEENLFPPICAANHPRLPSCCHFCFVLIFVLDENPEFVRCAPWIFFVLVLRTYFLSCPRTFLFLLHLSGLGNSSNSMPFAHLIILDALSPRTLIKMLNQGATPDSEAESLSLHSIFQKAVRSPRR